ncbi:MAG TPA: putative zinc-binding peptidase [Rhodopila sp.]|nr:putative zinc-binding peptidase [Rhodopila sp.]
MRLFTCQHCGQLLYFENVRCEKCGYRLGYLPSAMALTALDELGDSFRPLADPAAQVRFCENAGHDACNWLIDAKSSRRFCEACRHNHIIPDLSDPANKLRWQKIEAAKHHLFYSLLRLGLNIKDRRQDPEHGLAFDFLADPPQAPKVMTGHDNGLITIALAEADDAERERRRTEFHEPYRSLLGHFRHEIGHYAWDLLIRNAGRLDACRAVFGDDTRDYSEALQTYYHQGAPVDWQDQFISPYASSHPWEDWAETWAHYLHIVDTLEMAWSFGLRIHPRAGRDETLIAVVDVDPYVCKSMQTIIDCWLPLIFAMNSLNRAMGHADLYPFVLSPAVIGKLSFIHETVNMGR